MIPPVRTGARKWTNLVWRLTSALAAAVIVIAALLASLVISLRADTRSQQTAIQAKEIATCINSLLGDRAPLQSKDTDALTSFISTLQEVLLADKAKQPGEYQHFLHVLARARSTLLGDKSYRLDHPLGHC